MSITHPNRARDGELHPEPLPVVPLPQDPFIPRRRLQRIVQRLAGAQFVRYLCVGVFNTLVGYSLFVAFLSVLTRVVPERFAFHGARLAGLATLASILSTPISITVAYFGYKFVVFRTRGNYLREWFKCFAVYGTGMIPGLVALGTLTRVLQSVLHSHAATLHAAAGTVESHLPSPLLAVAHKLDHGPAIAGYLAGAITTAVSTVYSYVGHKKVTFKQRSPA